MKPGEAIALLKKYGVGEGVIDHVKKVRNYAMEIARDIDCDRELVEAGALLHDIGRSRSHGMDHAVIGAGILREEGVDERIVRIVERHIGAGISKEEAPQWGLPPKDYIPETIEEKIVCHADNMIGSKERISIHDAVSVARENWTPGGQRRLKQFHFEVFKPHEGTFERGECSDEIIREIVDEMDVLYKMREEGDRCIISLYGYDAEKALRRLKKMIKKSVKR
ncbi:MAG TPA: HDIG domain-containing protein [Methanocella sp.]|nr:HDIG domain-containing protein [Methanocella sp.]